MSVTRDEVVELIRDGKKHRERRGRWERFWLAVIVRLLIAPFDGWVLMLTVGWVHHLWWPAVPTIGYWTAVVVALGLTALLGNRYNTNKTGGRS